MRKLLLRGVILGMAYWCFSSPDTARAGNDCDADCAIVGLSCTGSCDYGESEDYTTRTCSSCT